MAPQWLRNSQLCPCRLQSSRTHCIWDIGNGIAGWISASVPGKRAGTVEDLPSLPALDDFEDERSPYVLLDYDIGPERCHATYPNGAASPLSSLRLHHAPSDTFVFNAPPPAHPTGLLSSILPVVPPTYALHTARLLLRRMLKVRYCSTITLTVAYPTEEMEVDIVGDDMLRAPSQMTGACSATPNP
ncbi:hypothetical protein B0H14DRAFT_3160820 [Mycena olivaceomarginata]|nr:hypothetical protein B0H14DRAFT_3160820 [Mycena olivaceomarginata]